jgi:hypothetical protein
MDEKETHKDFLINNEEESAPPAEAPSTGAAPSAPQARKPMPAWLRTTLLWGGGVLTVFAVGALAVFFIAVRPLNAELSSAASSLAAAETRIGELTGDLADAEATIEALRIEEARFQLMQMLLKATEAKAALLEGDTVETRVKLESVKNALRPLLDDLEAHDATLATSLPQRIELIQTNLETNADKALVDLDLLIDDLVEAQGEMFK